MKRTKYMQHLMTDTYPQVGPEAVLRGFDGAWERCIAKLLQRGVMAGYSEAEVILQAAGGNYLKAAYLITSSKPTEHEKIPG